VAGADNIIVTMTHASKSGQSKLLAECTLPLTGKGCIKRVLTDLAFMDIEEGKFVLRERAPGIVYASISAFGQTGPYRDRPAHDLSVNALAGIASLSVDPDGKPTMPCIPPSDLAGSLMALSGILMALLKRAQTGEGDYVDIGMFDAALSWTPHVVGRVFADGVAPQPSAERTQGGAAFYRPYRTKDGRYITLGGGEIKFASNFLEGIGRPDLIPLAKEPPGEPQAALHAFLEETFMAKTQDEWVTWFEGRDICFAPVKDLLEAFDDPHLHARDMLVRDATGGSHLGIPIKFENEPGQVGAERSVGTPWIMKIGRASCRERV